MRAGDLRYAGDERVRAGRQVPGPGIVFACDSAPEMDTEAPEGMVKVYPRRIDLENTARLASFERTEVVLTLDALEAAIAARRRAL